MSPYFESGSINRAFRPDYLAAIDDSLIPLLVELVGRTASAAVHLAQYAEEDQFVDIA